MQWENLAKSRWTSVQYIIYRQYTTTSI